MSRVVVRPLALIDLAEIWAYIAADSVQHADDFADLIETKFQSLARHPNMGRSRPELTPDICSLVAGHHIIFYIPFPAGIDVVRVLHGARDIESILGDDG